MDQNVDSPAKAAGERSSQYRPVALRAVRAAYSIASSRPPQEDPKDSATRFLVPESLPE